MNIHFTTLLTCFLMLTKLSLSFTFHNLLGTLWARFVRLFEQYLYLLLQSSHFVRGICLAEVEHTISQWNGVGITFYSVIFFLTHVLIFSTRIFPYSRLPQHCEYHNTSTLSMNVAIILWRCFLTMLCGNVVATLLKLSWNMLQQLHVPACSQLSLNVVAMFLQLSSMTLRQHQVGTFSQLLLNI